MNNSDAEGGDEEMDVETAIALMEDSQLVSADDDHLSCYLFEPNEILLMVCSTGPNTQHGTALHYSAIAVHCDGGTG